MRLLQVISVLLARKRLSTAPTKGRMAVCFIHFYPLIFTIDMYFNLYDTLMFHVFICFRFHFFFRFIKILHFLNDKEEKGQTAFV